MIQFPLKNQATIEGRRTMGDASVAVSGQNRMQNAGVTAHVSGLCEQISHVEDVVKVTRRRFTKHREHTPEETEAQ